MNNEMHTACHEDLSIRLNKFPGSVFTELDIEDGVARHTEALKRQTDVLDIVIKSRYSRKLIEKDHERGQAYFGFLSAVKTMRHHPDKEMHDAAVLVLDIIGHYGNVPRRPYNEETVAIEDLLREFEREDLAAALKLLGVLVWLKLLEDRNNEFRELMQQRYDEKVEMPTIRMRDARKDTDAALSSIIKRLEYSISVGKITENMPLFVAEMNVVLKRYKDLIAQKAGIAKAKGSKKETADSKDSKDSKGNSNDPTVSTVSNDSGDTTVSSDSTVSEA